MAAPVPKPGLALWCRVNVNDVSGRAAVHGMSKVTISNALPVAIRRNTEDNALHNQHHRRQVLPDPTIYIDADACPVKPEIARVAERHGLQQVYVANSGMRPSRDPMVRHVVVSDGFDAADDWIVEQARANDIAITADVPLAARLVEKGVHVLGPTGRPFTPESIGLAVAMRDLKQDLREAGAIKGYNPGFTTKDRSAFLQALDQTVRRAQHAASAV
jgi:uncharacterized protein YaiI (UPF0178 family)